MAEFNGGKGPDGYVAEDEGTYDETNLLVGAGGDDTLVGGGDFDTIDGGEGNDRLTGNEGRDFLEGREGDDRLDGGDGDDEIRAAGGGRDTVVGGDGDDTIHYGGADETIGGGAGDDRIIWQFFVPGFTFKIDGGSGDDTVTASAGADRYDGGDGADFIDYFDGTGAFKLDLNTGVGKFGAAGDRLTSVENVGGGLQSDTIIGSAADNAIDGYIGNDSLTGGLGSDSLLGFFGSDRIDGGPAGEGDRDTLVGDGDIVDSAFEVDTLVLASATSGVVADLIGGFTKGGSRAVISGFEKIEGSGFDDVLRGSDESTREGQDTLVGLAGNDRLEGRGANDRLNGGDGDDTVEGGAGGDKLFGGGGRDVFFYGSIEDSPDLSGSVDRIFDLHRDEGDRINLSKIDADETTAGRQGFHFVKNGPFEAAGDLRYESTGRGFVLYGDCDGDGTEDFVIDVVTAATPIRGDFIL